MTDGLDRLAQAARTEAIPGGAIRDGGLNIERLAADPPDGADELILDLYKRVPDTRITDIMMDVDAATGFTDAFPHLRTGVPCTDRTGLLNVLLAEGINLGLAKMAESTNTHGYWDLMRISRWHVEGEAIDRALAISRPNLDDLKPLHLRASRRPRMNMTAAARAMVVAAAMVPTGSAGANEAETSGWEVDHGTDRITESTVWHAFSRTVRPEDVTSPTLRRLEGRIEFDCSADNEWVGVALSEKAQLHGSQNMLFGGNRFAEIRTRWDNTVVTMRIDYEPGSRYLRFQKHDEALERLKRAETLLVELSWVNDEWVYFRFSLSGSHHAIEHVRRECEALPETTATRTDAERFLEFIEELTREAQHVEKERLAPVDAGRIEYIAQIKDKIERNWLRPPGTAKGLKCVVRVSQIPGGEVVEAEIRESSGNIAFDRSVEEAVLRSSPLPVPKDPSLFDRRIVITFESNA